MGKAANNLRKEILLEISRVYRGSITAWKNERYKGQAVGSLRRVDAGIDGQADITGIIAPTGRRIEIEVKTPNDYQRGKQESFQETIEKAGGVYIIARSVEQCMRDLEGKR